MPDLLPDPLALARRADAISAALASLRNAVQGRGVHPVGPAVLAEAIGQAQELWLSNRARLLEGWQDGSSDRGIYEAVESLEAWERQVNELAARTRAAGIETDIRLEVTHTASSPAEAVDELKSRLSTFAIGAAVLGAGVFAAYWWSSRRGS